ncbi:hypothetical protein [Microbacterium sp. NPDC090003]|uniref:hypothetical protein n=1 Tax=Microbacterium sp. NPDC090003 TaxID=3364203 RepID=UPI0037FBE301
MTQKAAHLDQGEVRAEFGGVEGALQVVASRRVGLDGVAAVHAAAAAGTLRGKVVVVPSA